MLTGLTGAIYYSNGISTLENDIATSSTDHKEYRIVDMTKRFLDKSYVATVEINGVVVSGGYTLDYAGGVVVFDTAQLESAVITINAKYLHLIEAATMFSWKLTLEADIIDTTTYADTNTNGGFKTGTVGLRSFSIGTEGYYMNEPLKDMVGQELAIVLYIDKNSNERYEGYGVVKKFGIDHSIKEVVKESLDIEGNGVLHYRAN